MTAEQLSCLDSVDQSFERMSKGCFTNDAVMNSQEWRDVRLLAADALKALGWPLDEPPDSDDAFIPARPNSEWCGTEPDCDSARAAADAIDVDDGTMAV